MMNNLFSQAQPLSSAYPTIDLPTHGYQSNNQHENFPPIMNDGRSIVASWQPGTIVNEHIIEKNGINSNWEYRQYLMKNSENIRLKLFQDALNDIGYSVRHEKQDTGTVFEFPKIYTSVDEPVSHREAHGSDLQNIYLSREQLQAKQVVPSLTQAELIRLQRNGQ